MNYEDLDAGQQHGLTPAAEESSTDRKGNVCHAHRLRLAAELG